MYGAVDGLDSPLELLHELLRLLLLVLLHLALEVAVDPPEDASSYTELQHGAGVVARQELVRGRLEVAVDLIEGLHDPRDVVSLIVQANHSIVELVPVGEGPVYGDRQALLVRFFLVVVIAVLIRGLYGDQILYLLECIPEILDRLKGMVAGLSVVAVLEVGQGKLQCCDSEGVVLVCLGRDVYPALLKLLEDILDALLAVLRLGDEDLRQLLEILDHHVEVDLDGLPVGYHGNGVGAVLGILRKVEFDLVFSFFLRGYVEI